jgi:hypothetical protein
MPSDIGAKINWVKILPLVIMIMGTILLIYMIAYEGEPGALPLLILLIGIVWFGITRYRSGK